MAGPALDKVLQKLHGVKSIPAGPGNLNGWMARCPAHEDNVQSLQVTERPDYSVGLHCHASCSKTAILSSLDLTYADLFASTESDGKQVVAEYDYRDIDGKLLYQAVRYFPKSFSQRRPDPQKSGKWLNDMVALKGKHVPYRLNELKGHNDVVIVEGEKDANRLWSLGIPATTNIGGATGWTSSDTKHLKAAGCTRAFIIPDNDEAGHKRTGLLGQSLKGAQIAVSVLELPHLPVHGDVSDWLSNGGSKDELMAMMVGTPYIVPPQHVPATVVLPGQLPNALLAPTSYNQTHAGAADAFCDRFGHLIKYDHTRGKWFIWEQHRWKLDDDEAICRMALDHARRWSHEVIATAAFTDRKKWQDFTLKLEQWPQLQAMLRSSQPKEQIKVSGATWDTDPWLLGVPNGVLNLKTGELRDGLQSDFITLQTGVAYDPYAQCPRWAQFMNEVFDDPEVVAFMKQFCGYCLTGRTSEQLLMMCYGKGRNGKGRMWSALRGVLGEYGAVLPFSSLVASRNGGEASNDLAALQGKRLVTASEVNEGARLNEARIKGLTGEDRITARFLYAEYVEFDPMAKFVLSVNSKPVVKDDSDGFWRRVRLVPFDKQFKGEQCDPDLDQKLQAELAGILAWCVEGCLEWQASGKLPEPKSIMDATKEYEMDSDPLEDFLFSECLPRETTPATAKESGNAMFDAYVGWCEMTKRSKEDRLTSTAFGLALTKKFKKDRITGRILYYGIQLKPKTGKPSSGLPYDQPPDPTDPDAF